MANNKDGGNGKDKNGNDKKNLPTMTYEGARDLTPPEQDMGTEIAKAEQQSEIQYAIMMAKKFPRIDIQCQNTLLAACDIESFAEGAYYSFNRGKYQDEKTGEWKANIVSGASIKLAREAFRIFGNMRVGFFITHDDDDARGIVAWAWDVEKNSRMSSADFFSKMIKRSGKMELANERDLREMTSRRASILMRNCILSLLPGYMTDNAVEICKRTAAGGEKTDLKDRIVRMQNTFHEIGISSAAIGNYLGKPLTACSREDLANLRGINESLRDGMISPQERQEMFGDAIPEDERRKVPDDKTEWPKLTEDSMTMTDQKEPEKPKAKGITNPERKQLFATAKATGKNEKDLRDYMKRNYDLESTKDLSAEQYKDLLDYAAFVPPDEDEEKKPAKTATKKQTTKKDKEAPKELTASDLLKQIKGATKATFPDIKKRAMEFLGKAKAGDISLITTPLNAAQIRFQK